MAEWTEELNYLKKRVWINCKSKCIGSRSWWSEDLLPPSLARAGVGTMTIVDGDVVDITNIIDNCQRYSQ
jgi:hypothetical protein